MRNLLDILMIQIVIAILASLIIGTPFAMEQVSMLLHGLGASSYIRAAGEIAAFVICAGGAAYALHLMRVVVDRDCSTRLRG